jgi:hypothetical protein
MKHLIVMMVNAKIRQLSKLITEPVEYMSKMVRDGISYPRKLKNLKNHVHFPAYKSAL